MVPGWRAAAALADAAATSRVQPRELPWLTHVRLLAAVAATAAADPPPRAMAPMLAVARCACPKAQL